MYYNVIYLLLIFVNIVQTIRIQSPCPEFRVNHGRVKYRRGGRFVKIFCNSGYTLAGDRYNTCVQGKWEVPPPKCVRNTCRLAKPPINGLIYPSHSGGVLNFFCKPGFILRGPSSIYCDGTKWDNTLPTCQKGNTVVDLFCDFERDDLCGWNHDLNHDFDWTRLNRQTPSHLIGTGPSYDHTKGPKSDGYYLYIESTSRNTNDTARLLSPIFNKTNHSLCFEFYYHMYGLTTGTLNVYLKKFNESWANLAKLWTRSGNQGDQWYRGFINLDVIDDDYQIVIEGVRGPGYVSDIAIDDVRIITNCNDEDQEFTTQLPETSIDPFIVESCNNRCNLETTTITLDQNNTILLCDCDDGCYERNRCCPDYFDVCTQTGGVSLTDDEITFTTPSSSTITPTTSLRTTPTTPSSTIRPRIAPTTNLRTTPTTTIRTTRLITKFRTTPTTTTTTKTITYIRPENDKTDLNNDIIDIVPTISNNNDYDIDKVISLTLSPPQITHERIIISNNKNQNDHQQNHNNRTVIFAVGVIIGTLSTMLIVAFVIKKYELFNCWSRFGNGIRQSSTGDSQSDVRFLTDDEVLDLNLPGDYDRL